MRLYGVAVTEGKTVTIQSLEASVDAQGGFVNVFVSGGHIELSRAEAERLARELQEINW